MQSYLLSAVAEKEVDGEELRPEQADSFVGVVRTNTVALFIVIAVASTLFVAGVSVVTAEDAARALEPVAGPLAVVLFGVGVFGASCLAATILPLTTAFVICEVFGWESGVGKRWEYARPVSRSTPSSLAGRPSSSCRRCWTSSRS